MMADVKRFMFLLIDTVGLLVDRTRMVAGFNHTPTYQARGRGVRQWRLSCIQQECSIGDLTLSCTQTFRHSSSAARWLTGPCTSWLTWPLWRLTSLSEMKQIMAKQFPGGRHKYVRHFYNNKDILDCLTISECWQKLPADVWYPRTGEGPGEAHKRVENVRCGVDKSVYLL